MRSSSRPILHAKFSVFEGVVSFRVICFEIDTIVSRLIKLFPSCMCIRNPEFCGFGTRDIRKEFQPPSNLYKSHARTEMLFQNFFASNSKCRILFRLRSTEFDCTRHIFGHGTLKSKTDFCSDSTNRVSIRMPMHTRFGPNGWNSIENTSPFQSTSACVLFRQILFWTRKKKCRPPSSPSRKKSRRKFQPTSWLICSRRHSSKKANKSKVSSVKSKPSHGQWCPRRRQFPNSFNKYSSKWLHSFEKSIHIKIFIDFSINDVL
jgi:hypothetical protein